MIDPRLDEYDWKEAFEYATPDECIPHQGIDRSSFTREDVAEIFWMDEGQNDGDNWIIAGALKDGRFFFLSAGCDYTGWDCQASGMARVARSKEELIRFGLDVDARSRFKLPPIEDSTV